MNKNPITLTEIEDTYKHIALINKEMADLKFALDESSIIAITDNKGLIEVANRKFCEISKYSEEELVGKNHRILNSGYHSKEFFREMWKTIGLGKVWKGEIQNKAKDGGCYWVHTTIVPILNDKGKPHRYISIRIDISEQKKLEFAIRNELTDDFYLTVKNLENGIFKMKMDETGRIVYTLAEGKLLNQLGLKTNLLRNKTPFEIFSEDVAQFKQKIYQNAFEGNRIHYEISLSGKLLYVEITPILLGAQVVEIVGSVHDVTELRSTQQQLHENQALYQSIFDHSQDAVFSLDITGKFLNLNPATEKLLGYSKEDLQKTALPELILDKYQSINNSSFKKALLGKPQNFDTAVCQKNGEKVHLNITYLPIYIDQQITGIYSIGKDITVQKNAQELNAFLANHDELTKLLNRRGFEEKLAKTISLAKRNNQKLTVMYIDVDRFKNINDTLGHYIGDLLLEELSKRLKEQVGKNNFIARMGGDEFMVLCPSIENEVDSVRIAKDLLDCLKEPFFIEDNELLVTSSIGVSTYPTDGDNVIDLMKHADVALYKAKGLGRNNYQIYSKVMDLTSYQSFILERDLRKAVMKNEFTVYLQPSIESKQRKIIGAEALIRWNHPKLGLIPPSDFIPLAEETGLIIPIGHWMKNTICQQLVEWRNEGLPLVPISINISAQRFLQKDFASSVRTMLESYGVEGELLEFEITENSLMKNELHVTQAIGELKELGIKIFIDDFGTGYSSFSYLKTYKLDGIKIDQSFIHNISRKSENAGITAAMIQLAKILNMEVIAEGVETEEELLFLHEHQCHRVQGYLFSKPIPINEFQDCLIIEN
ncbi:EAL domain-containing protein [Neobacillus jeddahensis]|uniref:EAL domain-containing protein n=1 Tax=Neobacillus jeddahensis TaxID=1461580 RepID=UPI000693FB27|nr:EAL domain-containing protein [Neobacillus jeddahensis]